MSQTDISIIIVNWNTRDILRDCMMSVYEQTQGVCFEVIVIDNASSDGSVEMVRQEFPQVILIENSDNRGFAAANNQGMRIAQGDYILLLNSDTIVLDGAIQKTAAFTYKHPEAAVVGCRVLNSDKTLQPTCFMFPSLLNLFLATTYLYKIFPNSRFFGRERMSWWDRKNIREIDVVTGCFMLVRRTAMEQVGLMDERYFMYGEETDWCWQFKKAGWKNIFFPDAQIIHLGGQSSKQVKVAMMIQLRKAILYFIKKNYSVFQYRLASLLVLLFYGVRIPVWLLAGLIPCQRQRAIDMARAYWLGSCVLISGK